MVFDIRIAIEQKSDYCSFALRTFFKPKIHFCLCRQGWAKSL